MKIICVGRNYTDHIKELDNKKPKDKQPVAGTGAARKRKPVTWS